MSEADDLHSDLCGPRQTAYQRLFRRLNKRCLAGDPPAAWLDGFREALRTDLSEAVELLKVSDLSEDCQRETSENGAYASYDARREALLKKFEVTT